MKKLFSAFLILLALALPANALAETQQARQFSTKKQRVSITATEEIASGEKVRLSVSVTGYDDPVITYIVKKPGRAKYSYLKKNSKSTSLFYVIKTEGEYSFKAIITEKDGSKRMTTAAATSLVGELVELELESAVETTAQFWNPTQDAPRLPATLTSATDALNAINRSVLTFGSSTVIPGKGIPGFFNKISSIRSFHNAFLQAGTVRYSSSYDQTGDGKITVTLEYDHAGQLLRKLFYGEKTDGSEETAFLDEWVQERLAELIVPGMTDRQKVQAIHDYIVYNYEYDTYTNGGGRYDYDAASFTALGIVQNGYGVCEAYAELFTLMSNYAGVPSYAVSGTYGGGNHMWSMVKLEGGWLHVDCTIDDPIPNVFGRVRYDSFLKTDAELRAAGYRWESGLWPMC